MKKIRLLWIALLVVGLFAFIRSEREMKEIAMEDIDSFFREYGYENEYVFIGRDEHFSLILYSKYLWKIPDSGCYMEVLVPKTFLYPNWGGSIISGNDEGCSYFESKRKSNNLDQLK